jgi:hypothetical protein
MPQWMAAILFDNRRRGFIISNTGSAFGGQSMPPEVEKPPAADAVADVMEFEKDCLGCWADVPADRVFNTPGRQVLHGLLGRA